MEREIKFHGQMMLMSRSCSSYTTILPSKCVELKILTLSVLDDLERSRCRIRSLFGKCSIWMDGYNLKVKFLSTWEELCLHIKRAH